jgi:hypothetical protein
MNLSENIVKKLQDLFLEDPLAIENLLKHQVPCNVSLSYMVVSDENKPLKISVLGLINTLLETSSNDKVAACYKNDKLVGFQIYDTGNLTLMKK